MPQIFHPSMNTISRVSIFGCLVLLTAAVALGMFLVRSPYVTEASVIRQQPIPFSHKHHVGDAGIDCRYCHQTVETQAFAGMPTTEVCLDCHSQLWPDAEMLAPLHESFQSGEPLHWTRVHDLPDYVYFHHGIHVNKGVACQTCHGPVDQMPLMWRENTLHMEWCLHCHRNPEEFIGPPAQVFEFDDDANHSVQIPLQQDLDTLKPVESKTNCSTCHR